MAETNLMCPICERSFSYEEYRIHSISLCYPTEEPDDTTLAQTVSSMIEDVSLKTGDFKNEDGKWEPPEVEPPRKIFHTAGYTSNQSENNSDEDATSHTVHMAVLQKKPFIKFPNLTCSVCKRSCETKHALLMHLREHTINKNYCCTVCGKGFDHFASLRSHSRRHSELLCKVCGKNDFKSAFHHVQHVRTHESKRAYECSECGKTFKTSIVLSQHCSAYHDKRSFLCEYCGKQVTGRRCFKDHVEHHNEGTICHLCKTAYSDVVDFIKHPCMSPTPLSPYCSTSKNSFLCEYCGKQVLGSRCFRDHIKHHGEVAICRVCNEAYSSIVDFITHPCTTQSQVTTQKEPNRKFRKPKRGGNLKTFNIQGDLIRNVK